MTTTRSKVTRRTEQSYSVLYRQPRPIAVSILPGDVLEFRELGRRVRFTLAVDTTFKYAVRLHALAASAEKRRARKGGR